MADLRPYLLAPYVDGGRDLATGVDCWGVTRAYFAREFGIDLPAYTGEYDSSENERAVGSLVAREAKAGTFQRVTTPELGDVVRLWWTRENDPSHVGIYLGDSQMLHARKGGVMVESLTDDFLARRVVDYWRHRSRIRSWRLAVSRNPLSDDFVTIDAPAGSTILEALVAAEVRRDRDGGSIRVVVGGEVVPPEWWARIRPKPGQLVSAQSVPGPPLVAFLALSITSLAVSGGIALGSTAIIGAAGLIGTVGAGLISVGLSAGLSFLASSLAAPPDPKRPAGAVGPAQSPLAAGTGNTLERWAKVAVGYGTMRIFPHLAAPAWTEIVGSDRYWRILLCVGAGRYQIDHTAETGRTGIEVGGVPIEELPGASWELFEGGRQTYDQAVLDTYPVDDSPDSYWKLNDAASPALNAVAGGVLLTQFGGATFGSLGIIPSQPTATGVLLDGTDDYLEAATSLPLADLSGDWTVELWAFFDTGSQLSTYSTLFSRGNGPDGCAVFIHPATNAFVVSLGGVTSLLEVPGLGGPGYKLRHVMLRRRSRELTLWVDGLQLGPVLSTATPIAPSARFTVGAQYTGAVYTAFLQGTVQAVSLYSLALSDDEIRLHYDLGVLGRSKTRILVDSPHEVPVNETITAPTVNDGEWWYSNWITREIPGLSDELSAEFFFPSGIYRLTKKGSTVAAFVGYDLEYKEKSGSTWIKAALAPMGGSIYGPDGVGHWSFLNPTQTWGSGSLPEETAPTASPDGQRTFYIQGNNQADLLVGFRWLVQTGAYSIRFRNFGAMPMSNRGGGFDTAAFIGDSIFLAVRGTKHNDRPVRTDKVSLVGVYLPVKETGSTVGQISVLRKRMVRTYDPLAADADVDGMTPEKVTDNAAWSYLDWLTNANVNARPLPLTKINLPAIADFATRAKPCHLEIDFAGNVWDTAGMILGPSLASIGYAGSKWTVVEDRDGKTPRQLLTPRNGAGWRWVKRFVDVPHAYRVAILDETKGYQDLEVLVFDDGYNEDGSDGKTAATLYQTLEARGITNRDQAIEYGKRLLRMLRLRHEEFTTEVLFEGLTAKRGDLVLASIPAALIGQRAGTIISVEVNGGGLATAVLLDELVTYGVGKSYGCRFRIVDPSDATQYAIVQADVTNPATVSSVEQRRLTFATPVIVANVPPVGALIAFGERGAETQECLVRDIARRPGFVASVTLIPYAPEIFNPIDEPAVFEPIVTRPVPLPQLEVPRTPAILRIDSDENYLAFTQTGIQARMRVLVQPARKWSGGVRVAQARARDIGLGATPGAWIYSDWIETFPARCWIAPVAEATYEVQARVATATGITSEWSTPVHHTVIGQSTPPPDVTEVRVESDRIRWEYPSRDEVKDLDGWLVRYRHGSGRYLAWSAYTPAHGGVLRETQISFAALPVDRGIPLTVLVKAVDVAGNESTNAAMVVIVPAGGPNANVVLSHDHRALGWPGTKTQCSVVSGDLAAGQTAGDDTQPAWLEFDWLPAWDSDDGRSAWNVANSRRMTYVASLTPESEEIGRSLSFPIEFSDSEVAVAWKKFRELGPADAWDGDDTVDAWDASDAVLAWGDTEWSAWRFWSGPMVSPKRKPYEFEVTIHETRNRRPLLTAMSLISDVEDREDFLNDVKVSSAGTRLPLATPFHSISHVGFAIQEIAGETAFTMRILDMQPYGPLVQALDLSGAPVAGTLDFWVRGY